MGSLWASRLVVYYLPSRLALPSPNSVKFSAASKGEAADKLFDDIQYFTTEKALIRKGEVVASSWSQISYVMDIWLSFQ
ncbi:unnamed protein product [Fusarium venenatum]|uniref:Uncharacterized protein n=1 Tax=Fusarium venenatum TaxID=56646 RepID=A0A2L2TRH0_9HYPO|nr:uncharacterized protein FVRRES_00052 [Fusarium venenatum]CEI63540.1 unnamed protein product [Fusarium venenatum]